VGGSSLTAMASATIAHKPHYTLAQSFGKCCFE
jgi:hypothetical protein